MTALAALALSAVALAAGDVAPAASDVAPAARDLEAAWSEATRWEVGSNAESVPAARRRLVAAGARTVELLVPSRLDTKDTLVTRALHEVLKGIGAPAVAPLRAALSADDPDVRRNAADLLGALGAREAAGEIARLLEHEDTRLGALSALGSLRAQETAPAVAAVLGDATLPERVRVAAAVALGAMAGPDAGAALVRALGDGRAQVRFAAEQAMPVGEAAPALRDLAANGAGPARLHAIAALGRSGSDRPVELLVGLLGDDDPRVRAFAAAALAGAPVDPAGRAAVSRALAVEADALARGKLEALAREGTANPR